MATACWIYLRGRAFALIAGTTDEVLARLRDVGEEPMPFVRLEQAHGATLDPKGTFVDVNPFAIDAVSEVSPEP